MIYLNVDALLVNILCQNKSHNFDFVLRFLDVVGEDGNGTISVDIDLAVLVADDLGARTRRRSQVDGDPGNLKRWGVLNLSS